MAFGSGCATRYVIYGRHWDRSIIIDKLHFLAWEFGWVLAEVLQLKPVI